MPISKHFKVEANNKLAPAESPAPIIRSPAGMKQTFFRIHQNSTIN